MEEKRTYDLHIIIIEQSGVHIDQLRKEDEGEIDSHHNSHLKLHLNENEKWIPNAIQYTLIGM